METIHFVISRMTEDLPLHVDITRKKIKAEAKPKDLFQRQNNRYKSMASKARNKY